MSWQADAEAILRTARADLAALEADAACEASLKRSLTEVERLREALPAKKAILEDRIAELERQLSAVV